MTRRVTVQIGPGEFLDRWLILHLKKSNFCEGTSRHSAASQQLDQLESAPGAAELLNDVYRNTAMSRHKALNEATDNLRTVHSRLWNAEDIVHAAVAKLEKLKEDNVEWPEIIETMKVLAESSVKICSLNEARHVCKREIDELCGETTELDPKQYFAVD